MRGNKNGSASPRPPAEGSQNSSSARRGRSDLASGSSDRRRCMTPNADPRSPPGGTVEHQCLPIRPRDSVPVMESAKVCRTLSKEGTSEEGI